MPISRHSVRKGATAGGKSREAERGVLMTQDSYGKGKTLIGADRENIMVIDDQPANLKLMEEMLRTAGYAVRSFPRGRLALAAAGSDPPDLILLDINMPEMNGFEVCAHLKQDAGLASIPVIFLSALSDTEDKVKAFKAGGVDYVTKPFQYEEVQSRVETHLAIQRARRTELELLEKTLSGAIKTMADLVHLTGASLSTRSRSIRGIVGHLTRRLGVTDPWQYDLAAVLCLIGCVVLPPDVFERAYGRTPAKGDDEMFSSHPETAATLLANIPRLENVAQMIRGQLTACGPADSHNVVAMGACMLRVAFELDRRMFGGMSYRAALDQLKAAERGLPPAIIAAVEDYLPPQAVFESKLLRLSELRVSMIADADIMTADGNFMIIPKGTVLQQAIIERIRNFDLTRGIRQPIHVRVEIALRS